MRPNLIDGYGTPMSSTRHLSRCTVFGLWVVVGRSLSPDMSTFGETFV